MDCRTSSFRRFSRTVPHMLMRCYNPHPWGSLCPDQKSRKWQSVTCQGSIKDRPELYILSLSVRKPISVAPDRRALSLWFSGPESPSTSLQSVCRPRICNANANTHFRVCVSIFFMFCSTASVKTQWWHRFFCFCKFNFVSFVSVVHDVFFL